MAQALVTAFVAALAVAACAPMQASRLYASGTEALDRGEVTLAVGELERAAVLAPDASYVQNHLGLAYAAAGREGDALTAFERAVDLDCSNEAAQENLTAARRRASHPTP